MTRNQPPIINGPVICTWLMNKQKSHFPPQSLESYPTESHFQRHQWHNRLIFGSLATERSSRKESLISILGPERCHSSIHAVQRLIITAQLNWAHCCRVCKPALYADCFMSFESKILKKTYHHSFVLLSVYRLACIDDYYIRRSLISGFCVEDKWKTKGNGVKMRKRLMSKHFICGAKH